MPDAVRLQKVARILSKPFESGALVALARQAGD
jgi:hypothetical protein